MIVYCFTNSSFTADLLGHILADEGQCNHISGELIDCPLNTQGSVPSILQLGSLQTAE
jgi:hypothetical protein